MGRLEVGAVCPNWASTDLCGGCPVTDIPTAIGVQAAGRQRHRAPDGAQVHCERHRSEQADSGAVTLIEPSL